MRSWVDTNLPSTAATDISAPAPALPQPAPPQPPTGQLVPVQVQDDNAASDDNQDAASPEGFEPDMWAAEGVEMLPRMDDFDYTTLPALGGFDEFETA